VSASLKVEAAVIHTRRRDHRALGSSYTPPSVTPYNSLDTNRENPVLLEAILVVFIGFSEGIYYTVNAKLELLVR
jgi:hypothetical protein